MERCWILLGMMGSGKSTVGRMVAEIAGRPFFDTDLMLHHKLGRPVHQLFAIYGDGAFRDHETSVLRSLEPSACVLATGGGIVLSEENWNEMRRLGTTIFLKVASEVLRERLRKSKRRRPLLEVEDWELRLIELLSDRQSLYEQADVIVDVTNLDHASAAQQVVQAIASFENGRQAAVP